MKTITHEEAHGIIVRGAIDSKSQLLAYIAANEARDLAVPQAIAALEELIETGEAIGGYLESEGHESPQADFLRALNKGIAALAALKGTK